jgi:hypothetical protein
MAVQKKSLISKTAVKKTQTASQEQPQSNELKATSLAAHSMKKKKEFMLHSMRRSINTYKVY